MSRKRGKQKGLFKAPSAAKPVEELGGIDAETLTSSKPVAQELQVRDSRWRSILYWFLCVTFVAIPFGIAPGYINPYNKAFFVIVLVASVGFIVLATAVAKKVLPLIFSPFFVAIGLWLLVKLVTTFTSISPSRSFWGAYDGWTDSFVYALAVAAILGIIMALYLGSARIARLLNLLVAQAVLAAGMTIWQAVQQGFFYQKVRPDSPLLNADFFISYALLFLPLILILLVWRARRRDWALTAVYGVAALVLSGALYVTLPTHLQTILLPAFMNGKKDSTYGATDTKSIAAGNFTQTNANLERWTEWKIGLVMGAARPLVGTGPGTTEQAFIMNKNHLDLRGWDNSHVMNRSHNDFIEQFSEEGILGLIVYVVLWAVFAWILITRWKYIDTPNRPYAWGLLGGLTLWLGFNILLFTTVVAGLIAWVWIALLLTMVKSTREIETPRARNIGNIAMATLATCLFAVGFWIVHYYVDDASVANAETINAGLANGGYSTLSSTDRVNIRLQAEAELTGAADDMQSEDYYSSQAALTSIDTFFAINFSDPAAAKSRTDNALRYARQALADDPYSPSNLQTLGGIEYYLAPSGSAGERSGIALIDRAINLTPQSVAWYLNAARIAALKKNYVLANSYIQRGLAATPKAFDHNQLKMLAATFPKS